MAFSNPVVLLSYVPGVQGGCCCFRLVIFLRIYFSIATVGGSEFSLLLHRCDISWYPPMIVTVFLCFFVMTAYTLAISPGHLSQLSYFCRPPSFVALSLFLDRQLAGTRNSCCNSSYVRSITIHRRHPSASLNSYIP